MSSSYEHNHGRPLPELDRATLRYLASWIAAAIKQPEHRNLRRAVVRELKGKVPGFQDPARAPAATLVPIVLERLELGTQLLYDAVLHWGEAHPDVIESVQSEEGVPEARDLSDMQEGDTPTAERILASLYLKVSSDRKQHEHKTVDDTASSRKSSVLPASLRRVVEQLSQLSPEAPEWQHWDEFLRELASLREARDRLVEKLEAERLRRALARVQDLAGSLGIEAVRQWQAARIPVHRLSAELGALQELEVSLEEISHVTEQIRTAGQNPLAPLDPELVRRREELRIRVLQLIDRLTPLFQREEHGGEMERGVGREGSGSVVELVSTMEASAAEPPPADDEVNAETTEDREEPTQVTADALTVTAPSGEDAAAATVQTTGEGLPEAVETELRETLEGETKTAVADERAERESELWRLLSAGDWAGAYWWSKACEVLGQHTPIASSALKCLNGALALADSWPVSQPELLAETREALSEAAVEQIPIPLKAAIALPCALFDPQASGYPWLEAMPPPWHTANGLMEAAKITVERLGGGLLPDDLREARDSGEIEASIRSIARDAERYLRRARQLRPCGSYVAGNLVFWTLVSSEQEDNYLYSVLHIVATDSRNELPRLDQLLDELSDRHRLEDLLQRIHQRVLVNTRHSPRRLEGNRLQRLLAEALRVVDLAARWSRLVKEFGRTGSQFWRQEQVKSLFDAFQQAPQVEEQLRAVAASGERKTAALARVLEAAVAKVVTALQRRPEDRPGQSVESLTSILADRLLWVTTVSLESDESGLPTVSEQAWSGLGQAILDSSPPDLQRLNQLVTEWIKLGDFRWRDRLVAFAHSDDERRRLSQQLDTASEALRQMERRVRRLETEVEQGVAEGSIAADLRPRLLSELEQVEAVAQSGRAHVAQLEARLSQVEAEITGYRAQAIAERQKEWEALEAELLRARDAGQVDAHLVAEVRGRFRSALDQRNLYAADEIMAAARSALSGRRARLAELLQKQELQPLQALRRFWEDADRLASVLDQLDLSSAAESIAAGAPPPELGIGHLPQPRYQEVARAFRAWTRLKALKGQERSSTEAQDRVWRILQYLGYFLPPAAEARIESRGGRDWSLFVMRGQVSSPVPEFGSESKGTVRTLVVWERPGATRLEDIITEAQALLTEPLLVIYMGRLLRRQREDLARWAFRAGFRGLVLDELLLVFLAREYQVRFGSFVACSLPFSAINPFRPSTRGLDLPREAFVGRNDMVRSILTAAGNVYVYGGRQLGKSALLRQVEREFHRPEEQRYAFTLDIRSLGVPGDYQEDPGYIWGELVGQAFRFIEPRLSASGSPTEIRQALEALFRQRPRLRVLVQLDEADAFLEADAERGFANTARLNTLVTATSGRLRFVFAGLQSVRRFRHLPNQPLGGLEIVVGPLDPKDARELVAGRMAWLGYALDTEALIALLGITNYHPGLLQDFCYRIVNELRRQERIPPFSIDHGLMEEVLSDPVLQQRVRDRFTWTLALDVHYQVLVRAMILDQIEAPDGFSRIYPITALHDLALEHWPEGFSRLRAEHVREYADELENMGILLEEGEGFRLRSPNVVRLLGSKETIENDLREAIEQARANRWRNVEDRHPRLHYDGTDIWSPFTQGQLRRLGLGQTGLLPVFGSRATGLDRVYATLSALQQLPGTTGPWHLDGPVDSLNAAVQMAAKNLQKGRSLVVLCRPDLDEVDPQGLEVAHRRLRAEAGPSWCRVICLLDHHRIDRWLEYSLDSVRQGEEILGAIRLYPWSEAALGRALEEMELVGYDAGVLWRHTGGYQQRVEDLLSRISQGGGDVSFDLVVDRALLADLGLEAHGQLVAVLKQVADLVRSEDPEDEAAVISLVAEATGHTVEDAQRRIYQLLYRGALVHTADGNGLIIPAIVRSSLAAPA